MNSGTRWRLVEPQATQPKPCVLIVDDEALVLRSVLRSIRAWSEPWEVRAAQSGEHALEELKRDARVDVLLTDLRMPGLDGLDLAAILKREYPKIVRVAHTGATDLLDRARGTGLFDSVLLKPATADQIKMVLMTALQRRRLLDQAATADEGSSEDAG